MPVRGRPNDYDRLRDLDVVNFRVAIQRILDQQAISGIAKQALAQAVAAEAVQAFVVVPFFADQVEPLAKVVRAEVGETQ